jgi:hypothetical protein
MESTQKWTAVGKGDGVLDAVGAALKERGWREITREGDTIEASFGSRLALRLFGVFLPPGRKRFPMRLKLAVAGSEVVADLRSDEGRYLMRVSTMDRVFMDHAAHVFAALRAATGSVGPSG